MTRHAPFREITLPAPVDEPPRAARMPAFVGCKRDAVATLKALKVFFIGAGSVGGRMASHTAQMGVSHCWITDHKSFKNTSALTHELSQPGMSKADIIAQHCKRISPGTRVYAFDGSFQALPLDAIAESDLVIMATDNIPAELAIGQQCLHWGKPLLHASVHGGTSIAQVRFLGNADAQGPCPACAFGPEEWAHLDHQTEFSCEGFASAAPAPRLLEQPTMSTSFLCATAADLGMNQILRFALGLGEPVLDRMVEFCGYRNSMVTSRLVRRANCPCDHTLFSPVPLPYPLAECSLRRLAELSGFECSSLTFTVADFEWVEAGACQCAQSSPAQQFVKAGQTDLGRCPRCGAQIRALPFFTHRSVPVRLLGPCLDRPLREVASARWVVVRNGEKAALFRNPNDGENS